MRKSIAAAVIAASAAAAACSQSHAEDGGPTTSRSYQVGNFQQIEVAGPYDVDVRTGANPSRRWRRASERCSSGPIVEVEATSW